MKVSATSFIQSSTRY